MANGRDKARSRANRARLREVLLYDWDPIGISDLPEAADEYDIYLGRLYVLLMDERATAVEISTYLEWAEIDRMGRTDTPELVQRRSEVVASLLSLREEFKRTN